jgi:hypothetical protein
MALAITDERVHAAAARLHDGGWKFSARQLYYAVCADVELPPVRVARGEVGLGALLILIGAITGQRVLLIALGGLGLLLVLVGAVSHVQERRALPLTRPLAISFADFTARFLVDGATYEGLLMSPPVVAAREGGTLVICDRAETADLLAANHALIGDTAVLSSDRCGTVAGRTVIAFHDCDPSGCALAANLRDAGATVTDAGIRPRDVLGGRAQILEGAPARLPRDLSTDLDAVEMDWLRSGRRLELATFSPQQLAERVRAALPG